MDDLTAHESQCCSFVTFTVGGTDAEVDLTITAPAQNERIVAELVARATNVAT